ncbi:unnamed protein product [Linum trigynum]|uniref:Uncharacterized protein n=1 Tax=Linum trigynum TaxID=586398 RepID=A0AAV2CQN9_9ROSI
MKTNGRSSNKRKKQQQNNPNGRVPEIPDALPLVGHLHLLGGNQTLSRKLKVLNRHERSLEQMKDAEKDRGSKVGFVSLIDRVELRAV